MARTCPTGRHDEHNVYSGSCPCRALLDLLAYRSAYRAHLEPQAVWGLGVVWGHELDAVDHQVGLCTPDRLAQALDVALTS